MSLCPNIKISGDVAKKSASDASSPETDKSPPAQSSVYHQIANLSKLPAGPLLTPPHTSPHLDKISVSDKAHQSLKFSESPNASHCKSTNEKVKRCHPQKVCYKVITSAPSEKRISSCLAISPMQRPKSVVQDRFCAVNGKSLPFSPKSKNARDNLVKKFLETKVKKKKTAFRANLHSALRNIFFT